MTTTFSPAVLATFANLNAAQTLETYKNVPITTITPIATLKHKVAIYVPGTEFDGRPRDNSDVARTIARAFSDWFGGATIIQAEGFYTLEAGELIGENVTIVYAYTDDLTTEAREHVLNYAATTRDLLSQECVAVELDNSLLLV